MDDVAQKIKGKYQQAKGDIKDATGDELGGAWDKVKGTVNEGIADAKMNTDDEDALEDRK